MPHLPNLLSLFRILLVPLLVVVLLTKFEGKEYVGLGLFLLAALTDFLDGYIARRWRLVTRLGKLLDPAADKILTSAAFISLVELGVAPAWMVVVIVSRDFAVAALRGFAAVERVLIAASPWGKAKTIVQIVAIALLIIHTYPPVEALTSVGEELRRLALLSLWVALAVSVYSGVDYFFRYGRIILRSGDTGEGGTRLPREPVPPS